MIDNDDFLKWFKKQDKKFLKWFNELEKKIEIKCKGSGTLELGKFQTFQGNLKKIEYKNLLKLIKSILKIGFIAPIFIWYNKNEILDGNQRLTALYFLDGQGFYIPDIPIVNITAKDKKQALLVITSHYADFDKGIADEWVFEIGNDIGDIIRIQDFDIDIDIDAIQEDDKKSDIKKELVEKEIKYFKQIHFLISFDPSCIVKVKKIIEKLRDIDGVEIEQSQN